MEWILTVAGAVFVTSLIGTRLVLAWLRHRAILDHPNERSSHSLPVPKGGGLAVTATVVAALVLTGPSGTWVFAALAALLGALSWLDDLRELPPLWRFLVQITVVAAALLAWPLPGPIFQGLLPGPLDLLVAGILWVWCINLFNFMDGIDGISGVEIASIGAGAVAVALATGLAGAFPLYGAILAAAALGFLVWNWHPAKIFLGDVGSIPLGFLIGWLLLGMAAQGLWAPALILPAYYLADATLTLVRRGLRGEKVWRPHREHFYQKAVDAGYGHAAVSSGVLGCNLGLVALAVLAATGRPATGVAGAALLVGLFLFYLATRRPGRINAS